MRPRYGIAGMFLFLLLIANLLNLSEAQAFRGRGAAFVVGAAVGSAGSSSAEASAAASQQQAAAAQQQAAMAQQQAAAAQQQAAYERQQAEAAKQQAAIERERAAAVQQPPAVQAGKPLPLGTVVSALPGGCVATPSGGVNYYYCDGNFYQAAYQGSTLVYVTTKPK